MQTATLTTQTESLIQMSTRVAKTSLPISQESKREMLLKLRELEAVTEPQIEVEMEGIPPSTLLMLLRPR